MKRIATTDSHQSDGELSSYSVLSAGCHSSGGCLTVLALTGGPDKVIVAQFTRLGSSAVPTCCQKYIEVSLSVAGP